MSDPKNPKPGDLSIDASDIPVVDMTPEQIQKASKLRDGADAAIENVLLLTPQQLSRAGINPDDVARLGDLYQERKRAMSLRPAVDKLSELLYESTIDRGHKISLLLGEMTAQARRRAEHEPNGDEILAPMETVLEYQYGPATRAALTKKKAAEAKQTEAKEPPAG